MIEVNALVKQYGEVRAIKGITFTAEAGRVTGFLGPNGAGKTTTMRILTGFMPPTAGSAQVAGYDVFEQSLDVRRRVGYLPENVPLYRDMTARDYLMYLGEIRGLKQRGDRADAVLKRVGLSKRAHSRIKTLSKGMKQRVGLAAALLHDPEVLILDEPTIGLDPIQVLELRDLVKELGKQHTVMFSTHILSEAEQVCDKVVIINRGEVVVQGSPAELRGQLEKGARVLLRVQGDAFAASEVLRAVASVAEVQQTEGALIITPASAEVDPRPAVAAALVQGSFGITEMRPLATNLEDIFIELTRQQSGSTPAAEPTHTEEAAS